MSLKIFTGFWCRTRSMAELVVEMRRLESKANQLLEQKQLRWLARAAVKRVDAAALTEARGESSSSESPYLAALSELMDRRAKIRVDLKRDPEVDTEIELTMWCTPTGNFVGEVLGEERAHVHRMLLGNRMARDFSVCTSTDRPAHVGVREWQRLTGTWVAIQRGEYGPSFSFRFSPEMPLPQALKPHIPSLGIRAAELAYGQAFETFRCQNPDEPLPATRGTLRRFAAQLVDDTALRESVASHANELKSILPADPYTLFF